jgi:hypothetical protein
VLLALFFTFFPFAAFDPACVPQAHSTQRNKPVRMRFPPLKTTFAIKSC